MRPPGRRRLGRCELHADSQGPDRKPAAAAFGVTQVWSAGRSGSRSHWVREPVGQKPRAPNRAAGSALLFAKFAPALFLNFDAMLLCRFLDPAPRFVAFVIRHILDLVEPGNSVAHVACVIERLLALLGKGKLILVEGVALLLA